MKRGAVRTKDSEFLGAWMPRPLVRLIDKRIQILDLDRSKFIRKAIREQIERELAAAE
jgi:metal-responsive CopG/Arc/MetJ family transcriptional regulator